MNDAFALVRAYGLRVAFADLGDWGEAQLHSEYDPQVPEIRLNVRLARELTPAQLGDFVILAIGHELYHHRERIGEVPVLEDRNQRERAAQQFAERLLHDVS